MLGAEAAAQVSRRDRARRPRTRRLMRGAERIDALPRRRQQVEVQIAVADVAIDREPMRRELRERGLDARDELRECGRCAPRRRASPSRRRAARPRAARSRSSHETAPLRFGLGDRAVENLAGGEPRREHALELRAQRLVGIGRRELEQHVVLGRRAAADRARRRRGAARARASGARRTPPRRLGRRSRGAHGRAAGRRRRHSRTASHAVARARGSGNSLSTAAVMTPSVPSAPKNNAFES